MAFKLPGRVRTTTTTVGTGAHTVGTASVGYEAVGTALANGDQSIFVVKMGINWEVFLGTYTASGTSVARTTMIASTNGDAAVSWTAGTKDVFVGLPGLTDMPAAVLRLVLGTLGQTGTPLAVRVATTANITIATALNNGDNLDGVTLATGDLVLVKDQSAPAENAIIEVGTSPARWSRFGAYDAHPGVMVTVQEGTVNADRSYLCTSNKGGTLGSTAIAFALVQSTDLRTILSLTLANDDILQRKSSAWTNRTMSQLWTDLMAVFVTTGQLPFPAVMVPSAGANVLDDYEEGSFDNTLVTDGVQFASTTYDSNHGAKYRKIGASVIIQGLNRTDAVDITTGPPTGNVMLGNFPFAAINSSDSDVPGLVVMGSSAWTTNQPSALLGANNSVLFYVQYKTAANGANANMAVAMVTNAGNSNNINYCGAYPVA